MLQPAGEFRLQPRLHNPPVQRQFFVTQNAPPLAMFALVEEAGIFYPRIRMPWPRNQRIGIFLHRLEARRLHQFRPQRRIHPDPQRIGKTAHLATKIGFHIAIMQQMNVRQMPEIPECARVMQDVKIRHIGGDAVGV